MHEPNLQAAFSFCDFCASLLKFLSLVLSKVTQVTRFQDLVLQAIPSIKNLGDLGIIIPLRDGQVKHIFNNQPYPVKQNLPATPLQMRIMAAL